MARRTAPGRTAAKKRKERRPNIPAGTFTRPEAAAPVVEPAEALTRSSTVRANPRAVPRHGVPIIADYSYVSRDLRRIGILTGVLVAGMVALALLLPG
jgi:hypothetical protein